MPTVRRKAARNALGVAYPTACATRDTGWPGIWGGIAGLGGTMGLVISGALTGLTSWRWIFLINLPVAG